MTGILKNLGVYALFERFGASILSGVQQLGLVTDFFVSTLIWLTKPPFRVKEIVRQLEFIGNKSLFIILLASLFTGMVFALQTYAAFNLISAETLIGPTVGLALTRELAPVMTGLLVTGRAGAAMSAQLGTMRVTEQIDALEVMGIHPKQFLVLPRIIASIIAVPILTAVFDYFGNLGAYILATELLNIDAATYLAKVNQFVRPKDIFQGLFKGAFFGLIFSVIGTYKGFTATNGARGVGRATNETVVLSSILILVSDYFLSAFINMVFYWR